MGGGNLVEAKAQSVSASGRILWGWLPATLDPGWASIIAAAIALVAALITASIGIAIIKRQAALGFDSLIRSQENQSTLDRRARTEQAELDRQAIEHQADVARRALASSVDAERMALAAALAGELTGLQETVNNGRMMRLLQAAIYEHSPETKLQAGIQFMASQATPIYDQQIMHIGILGPSLAGDVVKVWRFPKAETPKTDFQVTAEMAATLLKGLEEGTVSWLADSHHVHTRLMSVFGNVEDPGPLYFEQQRRSKTVADAGAPNGPH